MHLYIIPLFVVAAVTLPNVFSSAHAVQDDKRLNILFERLHATQDRIVARSIEADIWTIWIEGKNKVVNQAMSRGISAMNDGQLETALNFFDEVIRLAPGFAEGWNKRATVFYLMKNLDRSVNDIAQTLRLEPRHFGALSGLGLINQALGHTKAAIRAYERALKINPHLFRIKERVRFMKRLLKGRDA